MQMASSFRGIAGVFSALALCVSSTAAVAATSPHQTAISPFVALSALGSGVSAAAICGSSSVASTSVAQGAGQGCVLPVVDPAAATPVVETAPPPVAIEPVAPVEGVGVSPLLLGLVGIAAAVGLYYLVFKGNDNFHIDFPTFPQSPA